MLVDPQNTLRFAALDEVDPVVDGTRTKWELDNEVTIALQRMPVTDGAVRGRSVETVTSALTTRFALGEVEGSLEEVPCARPRDGARCVAGQTRVPAGLFVRRGMLLRVGDDIVLIEAIGPERIGSLVREQGLLIEQTAVEL